MLLAVAAAANDPGGDKAIMPPPFFLGWVSLSFFSLIGGPYGDRKRVQAKMPPRRSAADADAPTGLAAGRGPAGALAFWRCWPEP